MSSPCLVDRKYTVSLINGSARYNSLVHILGCQYEEINLSMLGVAIFDRGWPRLAKVTIYSIDMIALRDIGHKTEPGDFVVVDNIYHYMQAFSGTVPEGASEG